MSKQLEIISGLGASGLGQSLDTVVIDQATGRRIEQVRSVQFEHRAGEMPHAIIEVNMPVGKFRVEKATIFECCPYCGCRKEVEDE